VQEKVEDLTAEKSEEREDEAKNASKLDDLLGNRKLSFIFY
jgi:hypothetical protein